MKDLSVTKWLERFVWLGCVLFMIPGCTLRSMNPGRLTSAMAAGQAGMFRRQTGQWPRTLKQMVEHDCPALDDATAYGAVMMGLPAHDEKGCRFMAHLKYKLELRPRAADLRMVLRDTAGKLVCDLVVIVPAEDGRDALSPQITMNTTLFDCPGEGQMQ